MTDFPPAQAGEPGPSEGWQPEQAFPDTAPDTPPSILLAAAGPAPQRRLTVLFRGILLLPHLFVLALLNIATAAVFIIGWWGALFTGRLPQFAYGYLGGILRWVTRVSAYSMFLTDAYPPFSFDEDPGYPVQIALPDRQRLNRAAVFFRGILSLPAALVNIAIVYGSSTLLAFIAWLITLFTGKLPASWHLANSALVRYQTRYTAYTYLLTSEYPWGLYGDTPGTMTWADGQPAAPEPGFGMPGQSYGFPAEGAPQQYGTYAGYEAPAGYEPTAEDSTYGAAGYQAPAVYGSRQGFQPTTWLLTLTSAAKALVTACIVLGAALFIGIVVRSVVSSSTVNNTATAITASNELGTASNQLAKSMLPIEKADSQCNGSISCVDKQAGKTGAAFAAFGQQLSTIAVPASAAAAENQLRADTTKLQHDYTLLSQASNATSYESLITSTGLQQTSSQFGKDLASLATQLQNIGS